MILRLRPHASIAGGAGSVLGWDVGVDRRAQQRADVSAVRWCVRDGMTISLHLLSLGRGQGGRRRKGREGVISVDPWYLVGWFQHPLLPSRIPESVGVYIRR